MNFLKKMGRYVVLESAVSIVLGIMLLAWPQLTISTVVYLVAGYVCVLAVLNILAFLRGKNGKEQANGSLIIGLFEAIVGVLIFIFPTEVAGMLSILLGVVVIVSSAMNMVRAMEIKKTGGNGWIISLLINIVTAVVGVIIIINPFSTVVALMVLWGILLLVKGGSDLVTYLVYRKVFKKAGR